MEPVIFMIEKMHEHRMVEFCSPPQHVFATPVRNKPVVPHEIETSDVLFPICNRDTAFAFASPYSVSIWQAKACCHVRLGGLAVKNMKPQSHQLRVDDARMFQLALENVREWEPATPPRPKPSGKLEACPIHALSAPSPVRPLVIARNRLVEIKCEP